MERKGVINGEATTGNMGSPWRRVVNYGDYARTWERTDASRPRHRMKAHDLKHRRAQPSRRGL
jgi:hypothetical protein